MASVTFAYACFIERGSEAAKSKKRELECAGQWSWMCTAASANRRLHRSGRSRLSARRRGSSSERARGERARAMITHYGATAPIIVICSDDDVDVDEARNLTRTRCSAGIIIPAGKYQTGFAAFTSTDLEGGVTRSESFFLSPHWCSRRRIRKRKYRWDTCVCV